MQICDHHQSARICYVVSGLPLGTNIFLSASKILMHSNFFEMHDSVIRNKNDCWSNGGQQAFMNKFYDELFCHTELIIILFT